MKEAIKQIKHSILREHLGEAIEGLDKLIKSHISWGISDKIDRLREDYDLMLSSLQQGMKDPMLYDNFFHLLREAYRLYATVKWYVRKEQNQSFAYSTSPYFDIESCRRQLETFFADEALGQPDHQRHQVYINNVFNALTNQILWTDDSAEQMEQLLLSETIDSRDRQMIVTAVMLSAAGTFDYRKLLVLHHVYRQTDDVAIRQRALVGWVMAIDDDMRRLYPEQQTLSEEIASDEKTNSDLFALQTQMVNCLNASRDQDIIKNEVLPDFISSKGAPNIDIRIIEDPDEIEDFAEREEMEKKIEDMEDKVEKIVNMQKNGSDMYFGGFAMMKNIPFFNTLANWFCPFYFEHPEVAKELSNDVTIAVARGLLDSIPLCDSDKYSFVFAMNSVVAKLPPKMLEMFSQGELKPVEAFFNIDNDVLAMRNYLHNLYRFFRLCPLQSKFVNIFSKEKCLFITKEFFLTFNFSSKIGKIGKTLFKNELTDYFEHLISNVILPSTDLMMLQGDYFYRKDDYASAAEMYSIVLNDNHNNKAALRGLARCHFQLSEYDEALRCYEDLEELMPDNESVLLNKFICMSYTDDVRNAIQGLSKINYEHPHQARVLSALGWAYLVEGNTEMALKRYEEAVAANDATDVEYFHRGIALICAGEYQQAVDSMTKYFNKDDDATYIYDLIYSEMMLILMAYNIMTPHLQLVADMIYKTLRK